MENSSESKERERIAKKIAEILDCEGILSCTNKIDCSVCENNKIADYILSEKAKSKAEGVIDAVENIYKKIDYKKCVSYNEPWINLKIVKEICVELKQSAQKEQEMLKIGEIINAKHN